MNIRDHIQLAESLFRASIEEAAPPGEAAETWIRHRKKDFRKRYGKQWQTRLYATAWKLFGKDDD